MNPTAWILAAPIVFAPIATFLTASLALNEERKGTKMSERYMKGGLGYWFGIYLLWCLVFSNPVTGLIGVAAALGGVPSYLLRQGQTWWKHATPEQKAELRFGLITTAIVVVLAHLPSHDGLTGGEWHPAPGVEHSGVPVTIVPPTD